MGNLSIFNPKVYKNAVFENSTKTQKLDFDY